MEEFHAVRISELESSDGVSRRWRDQRGAAGVHAHGPLRDVKMVRPHVGQGPTGKLTVTAEERVVPVHSLGAQDLVVAAQRGWAQPQLPIHIGGCGLIRKIASHRRSAHAHVDRLEAANPAIPDELHGLAEPVIELTALLASGLEDDAVLFDCIHQQTSLVDVLS